MQDIQNPQKPQISQFHLINEQAELQPGLSDHLKSLFHYNKDYCMLSIIGSQSSGKSTLLNNLFQTNFEVLNSTKERRQVTKGIWLASGLQNSNLLVMDVEGSDSKERWDERHVFEQSTALFALALSQVLIINLWTHEVGRFSGSQYGILKVIFEMNIKLFGQKDQLKQLIFILRDYSEMENFNEIQDLIRGDIHRIWQEISKPPEFESKDPEKVFKIDFFKLSHIRFAKQEFQQGIENLKDVLTNKQSQNYLLKDFDQQNNLLLADIPLFASQIWETIKSNKDLNLPSEKIMISNMRCNQISQETLQLIDNDMKKFHKTNSSKQIYQNFGQDGKAIINKGLNYYDENSQSYQVQIRLDKRQQLQNSLISKFYMEFELQKKIINSNLLNQYIKQVQLLGLDKGEMQSDIHQKLNQTRDQFIQLFQETIQQTEIQEDAWDLEECANEFQEILIQQQNTYIDKYLTVFLSTKEKQLRKEMEKARKFLIYLLFQQMINANFIDIGLDFWFRIQKICSQLIHSEEDNIEQMLQCQFNFHIQFLESFKLTADASQEKLRNFKTTFGSNIKAEIERKAQDLQFYAVKKFKTIFCKNPNGSNVIWKAISEEEIEQKFTDAKSKVIDIINQFQYYELNIAEFNGNQDKQLETTGARLIEEDKFNKLISRLNQDLDQEYKIAIDKHSSSSIPVWMWIVLVFFGYDDIWRWVTNSWLFYPILLIIFFIISSVVLGQKQLPLQLISKVIEIITTKFGPQLFKLGMKA